MTDQSGPDGLATERSAGHRSVKRLRRLVRQSKVRSEERAFVVEGGKLVVEALCSNTVVEEIFVTADFLGTDTSAASILSQAEAANVAVHRLADDVLRSVLDTVNPQPVVAVVASPRWTIDAFLGGGSILVGVELQDPGNAGAIMRTAEAAGCAGVIMCTPTVDWLNPKAVRASAGSALRLPVMTLDLDDALAAIGNTSRGRRPVVATSPTAGETYDQVDLDEAVILVGNEPRGLPDRALAAADRVVSIPMGGAVESLNVAAAASVLVFESQRQRRLKSAPGAEAATKLDPA